MRSGFVDLGGSVAESELVAATRTAQDQPRVVAVLSGSGGTGTTATAIGLGLALARNRADKTVLVDTHAGTASIGTALAQRLAPTPAELARDPWGAAALSTPDGLYVVDGLPWAAPLDPRDMRDALGVLTATYTFVITDVGNDRSAPAQAALDAADQVVLVVRPGPTARPCALAALDRLAAGDPGRLDTTVVAVVADPPTRGGASRRAVVVPHDPGLAGRTCIPAQRLRPATSRAYLTIAARVALFRRP
jgi:MinD-like ATPase involved in chromosome partitioning or flagellar assembly